MRFLILYILNLFILYTCRSQSVNKPLPEIYIRKNDTLNSTLKNRLILVGEFHYEVGNLSAKLSFIKLLHKNKIYPKYILEEHGQSYAYLLNKYLKSGNEYFLETIEYYQESKELFRNLRNYYLLLPDSNRFNYVGVDIEKYYYITVTAIKDIFKDKNNYLNTFSFSPQAISLIDEIVIMNNPIDYPRRYLKQILNRVSKLVTSEDSVETRKLCGDAYLDLYKIITSYKLAKKRRHMFLKNESKKFKIKRDRFMADNIYKTTIADTTGVSLGFFGMYHVMLNHERVNNSGVIIPFASMLNSEKQYPLLNNKITSSFIFYTSIPFKYYSFVKEINQKEIDSFCVDMGSTRVGFFRPPKFPAKYNLIILKQ